MNSQLTARNCYVIIQCTNVSDQPLCYCTNRSVFSGDERLNQVEKTLQSIHTRDHTIDHENHYIILVEVSHLTPLQETIMLSLVNNYNFKYINLANVPQISLQRDSLFKGPTELRALLYLIDHNLIPPCDFLVKISGRYELTEDYNTQRFDADRYNVFMFEENHSISTVLYVVPKNLFTHFSQQLKQAIEHTWNQYVSIEYELFKGCDNILNNMHPIGVQGLVAVNGTNYRI
jgi:hypothetical protein